MLLIHRSLPVGHGILISPNCVVCPNVTKSIWHALWDCRKTYQIWQGVDHLLQLCQVQGIIKWGNICWLSLQSPVDKYEHQEEGMTLVIKEQEILFSTIDNIHSTHINAKAQVVLELVSPITPWILWKQWCRWVFSNQIVHQAMLLQEIWSDVVATLKSQYYGLKAGSDGVERQRLAFIQQ